MPSKTPGGRHAINAGKARYKKEREAYRAKLARRREREAQSTNPTSQEAEADV